MHMPYIYTCIWIYEYVDWWIRMTMETDMYGITELTSFYVFINA